MVLAAGNTASLRQQEEDLLYSGLCMLNLTQADGGKNVDISKGMFRKPNPRAFELVLYHTFCVVKGKTAAKKFFKGLWPLIDKDRKQAKDFYQRVQDWLKESGQLADHASSLVAFQRNPSGPKLVSFLCDLTDWALCVQHERTFPDDTLQHDSMACKDMQLLLGLAEPLVTAGEAANQLQATRLLELCQQGAQLQGQAESAAVQLKELYYSLTAQLREAQEQAGIDQHQQAGPSLHLHSILSQVEQQASSSSSNHAGGGSSSGSIEAGSSSSSSSTSQLALTDALLQQQQEVHQLWQQLDSHMQDFAQLHTLVHSLCGVDEHPHAIDAAQLRAYGQLPGGPSGAALDITAMVEAWLHDVGSVCRYVRTLAGQAMDLAQQQAHQQRGWLAVKGPGGGGIGRSTCMTPLVACSDAGSHATHLFAQLQLHRHCRDGLLALKTGLDKHMQDKAVHVEALQGELLPVIEEQARQEQELAAAAQAEAQAAATAAGAWEAQLPPQQQQQQHSSTSADVGGPSRPVHGPTTSAPHDGGLGGGSLFGGSGMQLVPPTPMLHQQLANRRRKQQQGEQQQGEQQQAPRVDGGIGGSSRYPSIGQGGLNLPAASHAAHVPPAATAGAAAAASSGSPDSAGSPCGLLLMPLDAAGHSPEVPCSPDSAALPAAELLMSRELMDLDLVGDDFDCDFGGDGGGVDSGGYNAEDMTRAGGGRSGGGGGVRGRGAADCVDDGGVFSRVRAAARAAGHRAEGGGGGGSSGDVDLCRISFARFSLSSSTLSPALAAAAAAGSLHSSPDLAPGEAAGPGTTGSSNDSFSLLPDSRQQQQQWRNQDGSSSSSPPANIKMSSSSGGQGLHGDDTPTMAWRAGGGNGRAAAAAAVAAAAAGVVDACDSPLVVGPGVPDNPLAPDDQPDSAQLSSAKPRRLTFAAAGAATGSSSSSLSRVVQQQGGGPSVSLLTTSSSDAEEQGGDCASSFAPGACQQQQGEGPQQPSTSLELLRQRFAANKQK